MNGILRAFLWFVFMVLMGIFIQASNNVKLCKEDIWKIGYRRWDIYWFILTLGIQWGKVEILEKIWVV